VGTQTHDYGVEGGEAILAVQHANGLVEGGPFVHGVGGQHARRQRAHAVSVEQTRLLLEVDRDALLIREGARRAQGQHAQWLRAAVGAREQMTEHLVHREPSRLARTEAAVRQVDRAFTRRRIRDQTRVDLHLDLQARVLRRIVHQPGGAHRFLLLLRLRRQHLLFAFVRDVGQQAPRHVAHRTLARAQRHRQIALAVQARGDRSHGAGVTDGREQRQLQLELLDARGVERRAGHVLGHLPRVVQGTQGRQDARRALRLLRARQPLPARQRAREA